MFLKKIQLRTIAKKQGFGEQRICIYRDAYAIILKRVSIDPTATFKIYYKV